MWFPEMYAQTITLGPHYLFAWRSAAFTTFLSSGQVHTEPEFFCQQEGPRSNLSKSTIAGTTLICFIGEHC